MYNKNKNKENIKWYFFLIYGKYVRRERVIKMRIYIVFVDNIPAFEI